MPRGEKEKMVAVVEDDDSYRVAVRRLLKSAGFSVQSFATAEDFLRSGRQRETGCLITDIRMPGMSGLDLQARLNADHCLIPTIFLIAHRDEDMASRSIAWLPNLDSAHLFGSRFGVSSKFEKQPSS
jgi:FixJ family two-component response regulator